MFSDEVTFTTGMQGTKYVIRTSGDRHNPDCAQNQFRSDRSSFIAWGMIGFYWISPLIILEGHDKKRGFNRDDYADQVLNRVVNPYFKWQRQCGQRLVLYEDGNAAHGLTVKGMNSAKQAKLDWDIDFVASPPSSPDFNLIEHVWRIIKSRIKAREHAITTKKQMIDAVLEEWGKIRFADVWELLKTMPARMKQAHDRKGLATKW